MSINDEHEQISARKCEEKSDSSNSDKENSNLRNNKIAKKTVTPALKKTKSKIGTSA